MEPPRREDGPMDTMVELQMANKFKKLKNELIYEWRNGKQPIPLKCKPLSNFIRNNIINRNQIAIHPNEDALNEQQREAVISNVVHWWFTEGLSRLTLGTDEQIHDLEEDKTMELNEIDLTLKNLGALTIKCRDYQQKLFESATKRNVICFMPTGSGKTRIAIKLIEHRLKHIYLHKTECINTNREFLKRHIIFLVCTTHLAQQQMTAIKRCIPFIKIRKITGEQNPNQWFVSNWKLELDHYDVLVMMHDCLKGALQHGHITFGAIDTLILDECHHVVGGKRHPYTVIMEKYHQYKNNGNDIYLPKIMGLTASPVKTKELLTTNVLTKIRQLQTMMDATLMRVDNDELQSVVSNPTIIRYPYFPTPTDIVPIYHKIPQLFKQHLAKYVKMMSRMGSIVLELGVFGACVMMRMLNRKLSKKDYTYWFNQFGSGNQQKETKRLQEKNKALLLFKTFMLDNIRYFDKYLHLKYDDTEWHQDRKRDISMKINLLMKFIADSHFGIEAIPLTNQDELEMDGYDELNILFQSHSHERQQGIIFVEERLIAYALANILSIRFAELEFGVLTGHSCNMWGMSDKEQARVINKFKTGDINYLIATSVAEEGIDIQSCNCVIMLVLPKTIKTYIQTRGRMRQLTAKYVVFYNPNNVDETKRLTFFEQNERDMVQQAHNESQNALMKYNRYEYLVPSTHAFASTVNAISMLHRYFAYLGVKKEEIIKSVQSGQNGFLFTMNITSHRWEMKHKSVFCNTALSKKEAERKVCVDIIGALKEEGYWNDNLVPIEVLKRCEITKALNKQRALCQSEPVQVHIASDLSTPFEIGKGPERNIIDDETGIHYQIPGGDNKIGYLYRITFEEDINQFPIGIVLPKRIPNEFLKFIHFPIQMRQRNDSAMKHYLFEYAKLVRVAMNEMHRFQDLDRKSKNKKSKRRYKTTTVRLHSARARDSVVHLSNTQFNQLVRYHQRAFELLDHGGSQKKKPLKPICDEKEESKENGNDMRYIICPLQSLSDGYATNDYYINWKCVDNILRLHQSWQRNEPNSLEYSKQCGNDRHLEFQLIQSKRRDGTNAKMYLSYGVDDALSKQCMMPGAGQVIADPVDEDERVNKILHCQMALDQLPNDLSDDDGIDAEVDEIEIKLDANYIKSLQRRDPDYDICWDFISEQGCHRLGCTWRHELPIGNKSDHRPPPLDRSRILARCHAVSIDEKCKKLSAHSHRLGNHGERILVVRHFAPKIRNVLVLNDKKAKLRKASFKSTTDFIPLKNVFLTGVSSRHFYQLLNMPAVIWRLENYFNVFDAHRLLQSICPSCNIDCDLLFEALCNAQADANKTYQRLECLGDTVLKCMTSIYGVFTIPDADQGILTIWKSNVVSNFNLMEKSKSLKLASYGVFKSFSFKSWHPSYFKARECGDVDAKISVKLPADIVESVIGALWSTINQNGNDLSDDCLSQGITQCMQFMTAIKIFDKPFLLHNQFKELLQEWDRATFIHIVAKSEFQTRMKILINKYYAFRCHHSIVSACLIEFIDPFYQYHPNGMFKDYGISYQRLEFLGDAILDLIVTQFLYKDVLRKEKMNEEYMMSVEGEITLKRSNIVSNDSLGFSLVNAEMDECVIWTKPQHQQINEYRKEIEMLQNEIDKRHDNWYTQAPAPKCIADAFEVLLSIVFIDSNYKMFENNRVDEIKLTNCIEFICVFLDYAQRHWSGSLLL
eukprot:608136_1